MDRRSERGSAERRKRLPSSLFGFTFRRTASSAPVELTEAELDRVSGGAGRPPDRESIDLGASRPLAVSAPAARFHPGERNEGA